MSIRFMYNQVVLIAIAEQLVHWKWERGDIHRQQECHQPCLMERHRLKALALAQKEQCPLRANKGTKHSKILLSTEAFAASAQPLLQRRSESEMPK